MIRSRSARSKRTLRSSRAKGWHAHTPQSAGGLEVANRPGRDSQISRGTPNVEQPRRESGGRLQIVDVALLALLRERGWPATRAREAGYSAQTLTCLGQWAGARL